MRRETAFALLIMRSRGCLPEAHGSQLDTARITHFVGTRCSPPIMRWSWARRSAWRSAAIETACPPALARVPGPSARAHFRILGQEGEVLRGWAREARAARRAHPRKRGYPVEQAAVAGGAHPHAGTRYLRAITATQGVPGAALPA
jgi:hypothetical protein